MLVWQCIGKGLIGPHATLQSNERQYFDDFDVNIYRPQYLLSFTYIHRLLKMYALLQYWLIIIYIYINIYIYITNYININ